MAVALLLLGACGGDAAPSSTPTTASTQVPTTVRPATTTSSTIAMMLVPNVVGKDLATARATFAAAGFNHVTANDGTQKKRTAGDDWVVYSQSPHPGERVLTSVFMYLEVLKKGEHLVTGDTSPCPRFVQCSS